MIVEGRMDTYFVPLQLYTCLNVSSSLLSSGVCPSWKLVISVATPLLTARPFTLDLSRKAKKKILKSACPFKDTGTLLSVWAS